MTHNDLPERWKQKIADYLTQKNAKNKQQLSASDFPSNILRLDFEDRSYAVFKYALAIEAPEYREIGIFTEHCGYHIFNIYLQMTYLDNL